MSKSFIKDARAIDKMRIAGQLTAQVLDAVEPLIQPGVSTDELNDFCHDMMVNQLDAIPAPLNYKGFPKSICTSKNHIICHGIPNDSKLKKGDIIGVDVSLSKDGYYGDSCRTFCVGKVSVAANRLIQVTRQALDQAIGMVKPGVNLKTISAFIQAYVEQNHCSVVREFCGHGIGTQLHEKGFQVLHYDDEHVEDFILQAGMTFTIEPMINLGKADCKILADEWTVVTKDRSLSAQFEHTLLVTKTGCDVLTKSLLA
jgi:methionyl aminopeptidase